jgi:hypothetical protein
MEFTGWYKKQAEACCRGVTTRFSDALRRAFFISHRLEIGGAKAQSD